LELDPRERALANAVADCVAHLLSSQPRHVDLVAAAAVATELNVSRDWVYAHAAELGGRRIGQGSRGRLRFDLGYVLDAWRSSESAGLRDEAQRPRRSVTQRAKRIPAPPDGELLPIRRPRGRKRRTERR
jgi:hypothetical protein